MLNRIALYIASATLAVCGWNCARAAARGPCDDSLARSIPARAADAPGGRAFAERLRGLTDDERETYIRHELSMGNIPNFLRHLVPVRLQATVGNGQQEGVIVCAAPDYLAIGSDADFLLTPMRLATALSFASEFGFTLPTPHIVDAVYAQAAVRLMPQPLPAGREMRSTDYSVRHNEIVGAQRTALGTPLGVLVAGDKKDLVLSNRLRNNLDRVAIYGWHSINGRPIQPLSTVHGWRYADYSHGVRLVSTQIFVGGLPRSIFDAMQDVRLAHVLSSEGVIVDVVGLIEALDHRAQLAIAAVR